MMGEKEEKRREDEKSERARKGKERKLSTDLFPSLLSISTLQH